MGLSDRKSGRTRVLSRSRKADEAMQRHAARHRRSLAIPLASAVAALLQVVAPAADIRDLAGELLPKLGQPDAPGKVLFREDFDEGKLERWTADAGWTVVDKPGEEGKCGQVVSSDDHEDLVLNQHIPVAPGHPIALYCRVRSVTGSSALFVRVDYFDEEGRSGKPYAKQVQLRQGKEWTENAIMISDWFPEYTRAITIHFHHAPNANTTSLLSDIRVVDLAPAVADAVQAEVEGYVQTVRRLSSGAARLPDTPVARGWRQAITAHADRLEEELAEALKLDPGSPAMQEAARKPGACAMRLSQVIDGVRAGKVTTRRLAAFGTKPITSTMVLPN